MSWIADPPTLGELAEETMWDLYRRRRQSGAIDHDFHQWCKDRDLDPEDAANARAYEDWFVECVMDEMDLAYWRERGFGS